MTSQAWAQESRQQQQQLDAVLLQRRAKLGAADSASEGEISAARLALPPLLRPAELLEAMPGLIVTQHSGDGKANQYFLRGFNLDYGSDFAIQVMGMPVTTASHAHGQGDRDLNFLMPELVASLRDRKNMFAAEDGDFASTGSARIGDQNSLEHNFVEATVGPYGYGRSLAAGSVALSRDWALLGAVEGSRNDGPWAQAEQLRRSNGVLRLSCGDADNGLAFTAMSYSANWRASEPVPARTIAGGELGRHGNLIANDGGATHRRSLSVEWARSQQRQHWRANAYFVDYGLNLFSGPSGFIKGPQGDQHEQVDHRLFWAGQLKQTLNDLLPFSLNSELSWGLKWRHDRIFELGLFDTVDRARYHSVREDLDTQASLGLFADSKTQLTSWLRGSLGLRWDRLSTDNRAIGGEFNLSNGGSASQNLWSPKLGLVARLAMDTELYADWGRRFRSNDVRSATTTVNPQDSSSVARLPLLARAESAELGLRAKLAQGCNASLVLWQANLAQELVFVGDEGVTEARGASKHLGLEWSNDVALPRGLSIDADLAWSHARFDAAENGGAYVPNAILLSAALTAPFSPDGPWSVGLTLRYIGVFALEESNTERSSSIWTANLKLAYRFNPQWQLSLDVPNFFDRKANDIEYWGGACTKADGPGCNGGEGIDGRLIHPMEPRMMRVSF